MTEVNNEFTRNSTNIITHQRDVVLFDMIAKGLAVTHRAFNAIELSRCELDAAQSPVLWVMMEKQCHSDVQQKLVEYVKNGGQLILVGRICVEEFNHDKCTILMDALGIEKIESDAPFVTSEINAFNYYDIPASFVETYSGKFDEIFAWREDGEVVGLIKSIGKGKAMLFGSAMSPVTLEDFDVVHQMALKMECQTPFKLSNWADIRLSQGENGSFLFINNYQDDPLETKIEYNNEVMFGGNPVYIPARQGQILPIEWQASEGVFIHYSTSEIVERLDDESTITFTTSQDEFIVELTLSGYSCDHSVVIAKMDTGERVRLYSKKGDFILRKRQ